MFCPGFLSCWYWWYSFIVLVLFWLSSECWCWYCTVPWACTFLQDIALYKCYYYNYYKWYVCPSIHPCVCLPVSQSIYLSVISLSLSTAPPLSLKDLHWGCCPSKLQSWFPVMWVTSLATTYTYKGPVICIVLIYKTLSLSSSTSKMHSSKAQTLVAIWNAKLKREVTERTFFSPICGGT